MRRLLLLLTVFLLPATPAEAAWVWPVRGDVITPYRNGTDPYASGQHRGIDIAADVGTPVVAAAGGEVRFAGTAGSSGLTIGIRTGDGYDTSYLHLSSLSVRAGGRVSAGERIGAVGTTGTRSATAPHLHFGVRDAGTRHGYHDPLAFLPAPPAAPAPQPPAPAPVPAPEPTRPPAPAPGPTRPAPAPMPAPLAAAPTVRPRPSPLRRPAPPAPLPWTAPAPGPSHAPASSIESAGPLRGPAAGPRVDQQRAARSAAAVHRRADARGDGRVAGTPSLGSAPRLTAPDAASPHAAEAAREGRASRKRHGPDIGWLLACAGLLLAAAALGLADNGRGAARPARSALARLRMPLARG